MKNYNKDYPSIDCDCSCEETVKALQEKEEINGANKEKLHSILNQ